MKIHWIISNFIVIYDNLIVFEIGFSLQDIEIPGWIIVLLGALFMPSNLFPTVIF